MVFGAGLRTLATLAMLVVYAPCWADDTAPQVLFRISGGALMDALDRFGEQTGMQVTYDAERLRGVRAGPIRGLMSVDSALEQLLQGSGLSWSILDGRTIVVRGQVTTTAPPSHAQVVAAPSPRAERRSDVTLLDPLWVVGDPSRVLPVETSASAFGIDKPLLETPRAISFISLETIDLFGLSAVEDLVRVAPGVFTTTRFGIQGAVDVRGVPADTYYRGMKRVNLQGHARSVLAAMDVIEVVKGPTSPIYGMGKIGGYTNMVPKSGRASTGNYLQKNQSFTQLIAGAYDRRELSFGLGGPLQFNGQPGGYYLYGLLEDSGSYSHGVPVEQQVLQAAANVDNFIGPFRLETGMSYQYSGTAGALTGRLTQDLVDEQRYIRGTPLVDLDLNGNGRIGYLELHEASPVSGQIATGNQPLIQHWAWPTDEQGNYLPVERFPSVPGIPQTLYDYLLAHPQADPGGLLVAQGIGGPLPRSGSVPIGMALDPRTVGYDRLDLRRAAAFEKQLEADFLTAYFDLVYDSNPFLTVRNQLFFDSMDQYKLSEQPFANIQQVYVIENKLTATRRLPGLPGWLGIAGVGSVNLRDTVSKGRINYGDYGTHRTDAMSSTWVDELGGMTPNTTFATPIHHAELADDGSPWVNHYRTEFWELGAALIFDVDLFENTNLLFGGRADGSRARNVEYGDTFDPFTGTSEQPGAFVTESETASGWDHAFSWTLGLSHRFGKVRPYFNYTRSSLALDRNNNRLDNAVIEAGHIGAASLVEVGIKASLFANRLFLSSSLYEQKRVGVDGDDDPAVISAEVSSTVTRGWEAEAKWVPFRNFFISAYALSQKTTYLVDAGGSLLVDARLLGFQDVVDASGQVVYPAEAFLYGGRSLLAVPGDLPWYREKQGNPNTQLGVNLSYLLPVGIGFTFSGNYFSSVCSGRLCLVELPESRVLNAGAFWRRGDWSVKADIYNLLDERYFRARNGDRLGDVLAQAMPDRHWELTVRVSF
jgi:outer membrane receptor protein involved in Fe transport